MLTNSDDTEENGHFQDKFNRLVLDNSSSTYINDLDIADDSQISKTGNCGESSNMSGMTNDVVFDDESFEADSHLSQLTKTQCEYLTRKLTEGDIERAEVNSQEEKWLTRITEKIMKSHSIDTSELDTQQFMELVLRKAEQLKPGLDVTNNQPIELTDSDDDSSVSTNTTINVNNTCCSSVNPNEVSNSEPSKEQVPKSQNRNRNPELIAFQAMCDAIMNTKAIDVDNGNKRKQRGASDESTNNRGMHEKNTNLKEVSNTELSKEQDPKSSNQHQNPEINAFRAMCDALMMNTKVIDFDNGDKKKQKGTSDESTNNRGMHENTTVCCDDSTVSKPSTSKSNSSVDSKSTKAIDDYISRLKRKRSSSTLNVSDESLPKYPNELSSHKQHIRQSNKATDKGEFSSNKKQKKIIFERINNDTRRCIEFVDCEPSTSKPKKAAVSDGVKNTGNIFERGDSPVLILSDRSSPDFLDELSQKPRDRECRKAKDNNDALKTRYRCRSNQQPSDPKRMIPVLVTLSSDDDEDGFVSAKVQSSKDPKNHPLKHKKIKLEPCEQNERVKEIKPLHCCVPNGQIHKDMLEYIKRKNGIQYD